MDEKKGGGSSYYASPPSNDEEHKQDNHQKTDSTAKPQIHDEAFSSGAALPHDAPMPPPPEYPGGPQINMGFSGPPPNTGYSTAQNLGYNTTGMYGHSVTYTTTSPLPQPTIVINPITDECPVQMMCPYCHQHMVTVVNQTPGSLAWIIFCLMFVLGFIFLIPWCLSWIPFVIPSCLTIEHVCPNCKRIVGRIER